MSDFEKQIHAMFDHIWDCDVNHPIFEDTVGELMNAVIQCYNNLPSAEPEKVYCKDCKYADYSVCKNGNFYCLEHGIYINESDFCSRGVKD